MEDHPRSSASIGGSSNEVPLGTLRDVPNAITASRLLMTVLCFVAISAGWYRAALVLFVLAAGTDWADGYWARRWGPITKLGRILDPLADKLLICGTFIYLAAIPESRIAPWMAVVVFGRELMVTTLRAMVESGGGDFSAVYIGKLKMVFQCLAVGFSLLFISPWRTAGWPTPTTLAPWVVDLFVWGAVILTIASGWTYVRSSRIALQQEAED